MSATFSFAEQPHRPVPRPGCTGLSALRVHVDEAAGLYVVSLRFEPHGEMDEHAAEHPILFIVTAGRGVLRLSGAESPIRAGQASYWPPGAMHQVRAGSEGLVAIAVQYGLPTGV